MTIGRWQKSLHWIDDRKRLGQRNGNVMAVKEKKKLREKEISSSPVVENKGIGDGKFNDRSR